MNLVKDKIIATDALLVTDSIAITLEKIRKSGKKISYFYVVDSSGKLVGVVSSRAILFASPDTILQSIMQRSIEHVYDSQPLHKALRHCLKYKLLALPVVDENFRFLGILDTEEYLNQSFNKDDIVCRRYLFQKLARTVDHDNKKSLWQAYCFRMPWICCNIVAGINCAIIAVFYENVLNQFLVLAMFIPLILTLAESIAMQAMSTSLHFISQGCEGFSHWIDEIKEVLCIGASCGVMTGAVSFFWHSNVFVAVTFFVGIMASTLLSSMVATFLPVVFYRHNLNPRVVSSPVILMLTDISTTFLYLAIANLVLL